MSPVFFHLFSITLLIYMHYSDHVCFSFQSRIVVPHCSSRVFSTPRGFSSLPLSPWSSHDVSLISSPGFILQLFFCRVHRAAVSQWNVIVSTDMAPDSPLGAASFFVPVALSTLELRHFTAAHLNISSSKSGLFNERLTAPS